MTSLLQVGPVSLPVKCESAAGHQWARPSRVRTALDGTRWAPRAPRPSMDIALTFDVSRPDDHATLLGLLYGEFSPGPFRLVDSAAAATNALSAHASLLGHWSTAPTFSTAPVLMAGGGYVGRSIVGVESGALVTAGWPQAAVAPPAGQWVTVSAYAVASTRVRIRPVWHAREGDPWVNGTLVDIPAKGAGLHRYSASAQVPASVTPSGGTAGPVARVGFQVYDASRIARPAISWTREMTEWGVGGSPRGVIFDQVSDDVILALTDPKGLRASTVTITAREVGPA